MPTAFERFDQLHLQAVALFTKACRCRGEESTSPCARCDGTGTIVPNPLSDAVMGMTSLWVLALLAKARHEDDFGTLNAGFDWFEHIAREVAASVSLEEIAGLNREFLEQLEAGKDALASRLPPPPPNTNSALTEKELAELLSDET